MSYYFSRILDVPFASAVERVTAALKEHGFGIVTEIDVAETFRAKLALGFRPYRILGACNPAMAYEALRIEDKIGTMLPCNVVVQELAPGRCEVAAIDPVASMQAVPNERLKATAALVRDRLREAVAAL